MAMRTWTSVCKVGAEPDLDGVSGRVMSGLGIVQLEGVCTYAVAVSPDGIDGHGSVCKVGAEPNLAGVSGRVQSCRPIVQRGVV